MITKSVIFRAEPGAAYTVDVESYDGSTSIQTGISTTEVSSGTFKVDVTSAVAADLTTYSGRIKLGGSKVGDFSVDLKEVAGTYYGFDGATPLQNANAVTSTPNWTIVIPAAVAAASLNPNTIGMLRGDTYSAQLPLVGSLIGYTKIVFAAKESTDDIDAASVIWVELNASGGTNGITILNGTSYSTHTDASLTITDATTGAVTLNIAASVAAALPVDQRLFWGVQKFFPSADYEPQSGTLTVTADVVRATT